MAISRGYVRRAAITVRPLTATVLDALREAVVVADAEVPHLPVIVANATAQRCLWGDHDALRLTECSLHGRFPAGDVAVSAGMKLQESDPGSRPVKLTSADPASVTYANPGPRGSGFHWSSIHWSSGCAAPTTAAASIQTERPALEWGSGSCSTGRA